MSQPKSNTTSPVGGPSASAAPAAPAVPAIADATQLLAMVAAALQASTGQAEDEQRRKELEEWIKRTDGTVQTRSQRVVDEQYRAEPGMRKFEVLLNDKNGNPKLVIPARSRAEALAVYETVCGIRFVENRDKVYVVSEVATAA